MSAAIAVAGSVGLLAVAAATANPVVCAACVFSVLRLLARRLERSHGLAC